MYHLYAPLRHSSKRWLAAHHVQSPDMWEQLPVQQPLMLPCKLPCKLPAHGTEQQGGPEGCMQCAGAATSAGKRGSGPSCPHAAVAVCAYHGARAAHARLPHGHLRHGESPHNTADRLMHCTQPSVWNENSHSLHLVCCKDFSCVVLEEWRSDLRSMVWCVQNQSNPQKRADWSKRLGDIVGISLLAEYQATVQVMMLAA